MPFGAPMNNEYEEKTREFLNKTGTIFQCSFIKYDKHFVDDKDKRDIYLITLNKGNRCYSFPFGQSIEKSAKYTFYSSSKGEIKTNNKKDIDKFVGRVVSLNEMRINDKQEAPTPYDVLSALTKNDVGGFDDFCVDFGYSDDSIKSKKIYDAVVNEYNELCKLYSDEELDLLREIQ